MILSLALATIASPAFAKGAAGPQFGVYTANVALGDGGHLEASIHVLDPPSKVAVTFSCGKPTGPDTVTEVLNTPAIPLRSDSFNFHATTTLEQFTTLTENNALLKQGSYKTTVSVNGTFTSHSQFAGTVQLGGSPCNRTSYTAPRLAGPVPG
jgi:hypothetical protein